MEDYASSPCGDYPYVGNCSQAYPSLVRLIRLVLFVSVGFGLFYIYGAYW